jgi:hypothetical protein
MRHIYKILFFALVVTAWTYVLVGCDKEVKSNGTQDCMCYESHEMIEAVSNGQTITTQWVHQYNTSEAPDLCTKDTDQYVYYNNNNSRYKVECH